MAREEEKRKRFWEDEEEEKTNLAIQKQTESTADLKKNQVNLDTLIYEARILVEQVHQLYQQYFNRVEKCTPIEKVRFLESKINKLKSLSPSQASDRFKLSQFLALYQTHRELWERKLKDKERGK